VANLIPGVVQDCTSAAATVLISGTHRVPVPQGGARVRPGTSATVMVRPERLRLSEASAADSAGVPVTVEHAVFQGPVVRCTMRASDGTQIVAHVGPEQPLPPLEPGLGLRVNWDYDAARLLPADGCRPAQWTRAGPAPHRRTSAPVPVTYPSRSHGGAYH
jgi:spermidine/putrescine transport system ATP-binding protein